MEKIFHVFVSSTYSDLIEERKKVSEAVAKAGYVAEGMEIFPASSQHQMEFIERVIDRCDYYILILAGRYGSVAPDGLSYTEKEFQYAKKREIPILAFIRSNLNELRVKDTESDEVSNQKLKKLIETIKANSLVDFWESPDELSTKALAALSQARVNFEGVGWIRANRAASAEILNEINELRKENARLVSDLSARKPSPAFDGLKLAEMDEEFDIHIETSSHRGHRKYTISLTWRQILANIGTNFRTPSNTSGVSSGLKKTIQSRLGLSGSTQFSINMEDKERILIQMEALGMMCALTIGVSTFHKLTDEGLAYMLRENVVKSSK